MAVAALVPLAIPLTFPLAVTVPVALLVSVAVPVPPGRLRTGAMPVAEPVPVAVSDRAPGRLRTHYMTVPVPVPLPLAVPLAADARATVPVHLAETMAAKLPRSVDVDDLMQEGTFGLMDAIEKFDPGRGIKFKTYCTTRIRGSILDELRSQDWVPRLVRARTAKIERVRKQMEMELGRSPTDDEICERLQVDSEEYRKLKKDSKPVGVVSLNRK